MKSESWQLQDAEYVRLEKFKAASMPRFVDHLLALPKDDVEFERLPFIVPVLTPYDFNALK
jgi:hypothetical protein